MIHMALHRLITEESEDHAPKKEIFEDKDYGFPALSFRFSVVQSVNSRG
jgi:hypothetical protein